MRITLLVMTVLLVGIVYRLFTIQIKDCRDFSSYHIDLISNSVNQKTQILTISSGRGKILDRNFEELIEQETILTVGIFPFVKQSIDLGSVKELADILRINEVELLAQINETYSPGYIQKNKMPIEITEDQRSEIEELDVFGIITLEYVKEGYKNILAKHTVGFLAQAPDDIHTLYSEYLDQGTLLEDSKIGRSGLQMTFQEILQGVNKEIVYYVDRKGYPLKGLVEKNVSEEDRYPLSIVMTIDKKIQSISEEQLSRYGIDEGSIVILDVEDGDILAMASTPDFDLNNINPMSNDWNNKAVQITEPGSIYKTIVAIAALEEGISLDDKFYCGGKYDYQLSCHDIHGDITFAEGYTKSCNIVFAEIAKKIGIDTIEHYAEELGVIGTVGWSGEFLYNETFNQIANEEDNRIICNDTNNEDIGSVIRTAIGQQDVRLSPLAAANLIVTILNNGRVFNPRLVEKVVYNDGTDYYKFLVQSEDNSLGSNETYKIIKEMMKQVVDNGTGKYLNDAKWNLAGKSGTAQTNNELNNQWFIGYGPTNEPKYAVAVLVKNVSTTELLAQEVFKGIMDDLYDLNFKKN